MNKKRRVGRPLQAAQTIKEALDKAYAGTLPKRPRNDIERKVMRKQRGRKKNPLSSTQAAVDYAVQMITDGVAVPEAYRQAALMFKLSPDTVRKALRKAQAGPQVVIKPRTTGPFSQLLKPEKLPLAVDYDKVAHLDWPT
jgi:DNA invertase Pin-like site-specific DNA recombinase